MNFVHCDYSRGDTCRSFILCFISRTWWRHLEVPERCLRIFDLPFCFQRCPRDDFIYRLVILVQSSQKLQALCCFMEQLRLQMGVWLLCAHFKLTIACFRDWKPKNTTASHAFVSELLWIDSSSVIKPAKKGSLEYVIDFAFCYQCGHDWTTSWPNVLVARTRLRWRGRRLELCIWPPDKITVSVLWDMTWLDPFFLPWNQVDLILRKSGQPFFGPLYFKLRPFWKIRATLKNN